LQNIFERGLKFSLISTSIYQSYDPDNVITTLLTEQVCPLFDLL